MSLCRCALPGTTGTYTVTVNPMPMSGTISMFPPDPIQTACPNCHQSVLTQTTREMGGLVWMVVLMLCMLGFVLSDFLFSRTLSVISS